MKRSVHKNEVALSEEQRYILHHLISSGKAPARKLAHARILLKIDRHTPDNEWTDEQVAQAFEVSRYTVLRVRERFVEHGLDDALTLELSVGLGDGIAVDAQFLGQRTEGRQGIAGAQPARGGREPDLIGQLEVDRFPGLEIDLKDHNCSTVI